MENLRRLHRPQQSLPKDLFPLPQIDQVIDSITGYEALWFLDEYSRYHQIVMDPL